MKDSLPPGPAVLCVAHHGHELRGRLEPARLERKLAAARRCDDLAADVQEALRTVGPKAFAVELLRPATPGGPEDGLPPTAVPSCEVHGEGRVNEGKYRHVLRRREHVLPLTAAIWRHAGAAG